MLTLGSLFQQLRPLIHPMVVHFPIALLYVSVLLDWLGYLLKHANLTRAGFYTLVLGAMGAGVASLTGPDAATGDASVPGLLAWHQTFASLTVILAVCMFAVRFLVARGLRGAGAAFYLLCTLALLTCVSLTGYFGGEMAYHHAVGVTLHGSPVATAAASAAYVQPLLPAKPITALFGFLCVVGIGGWLLLGRLVLPRYFTTWWRAVRQEISNANAPLWTLQRGKPTMAPAYQPDGSRGAPSANPAPSRRM